MKVIFLDFDGVINNWEYFDYIDEQCVKRLKYIIEKTNSNVVATTSNKYTFQIDKNIPIESTKYYRVLTKLQEHGIQIDDITPLVNQRKKLEIDEYLKKHPEIKQYLILDDEYISDSHKDHQVYLDLYNGIQDEHIAPAINILNGKLGFYPNDYNTKETAKERIIRINRYHQNL